MNGLLLLLMVKKKKKKIKLVEADQLFIILKECSFNVFSEHMSVASAKPDFMYKTLFLPLQSRLKEFCIFTCKQHIDCSG